MSPSNYAVICPSVYLDSNVYNNRKIRSNEIDFREVYEGFVGEESVQSYKSTLLLEF